MNEAQSVQDIRATAESTAAGVLAAVLKLDPRPPASLDLYRQRIEALADPTSPQALAELQRQQPILEALWHRFALDAVEARSPANRERLLRAALHAQQAHARTVVLIRAMALQEQQRLKVVVNSDGDGDALPPFNATVEALP
jgi:hypothetical protein